MRHFVLAAVASLVTSVPVVGQVPGALPAIRPLGPRLAITTDLLGSVADIRPLSDGRVLVDDYRRRELLLFDSTLTHSVVIADTTGGTKKSYGTTQARLLASVGDTTFFVVPGSVAMLVIAPGGTIVRVMAPPAPRDVGLLVGFPKAAFDGHGRLVYSEGEHGGITVIFSVTGAALYLPPDASTPPSEAQIKGRPAYALLDSIAILRADPKGQTLDTAGFIATPMTGTGVPVSPVRIFDDWAVLSDGSVAFVRGLDYHIDWVNADGTRSSTPRIAHDWHRLSDSERVAIVDRANFVADSVAAQSARIRDSMGRVMGRSGHPSEAPREHVVLTPSDLPDYFPAFSIDAVQADADDNLWIRLGNDGTMNHGSGGPPPVYDIVNRAGRLIDRVQLPASMNIIGFGRGVVYLTDREGAGAVLARYRIK